jgi:Cof subfamily protein (haloacid dehalogenase superfamily)
MVKLALSDMDNTLLAYGRPFVSRRAIEAIHRLGSVGVRFAPASGRGIHELRHFFQDDDASVSTALAANGQQVYVDGELVKEVFVDHDAVVRAAESLRGLGDACIIIYGDGTHPTCAVDLSPAVLDSIRDLFPLGVQAVGEVPDHPFVKACVAVAGSDEHVAAVGERLRELCPELDFIPPVPNWFDIVPAGWTKAEGVRILVDYLGLGLDQVVAFGDSDNDLAMLRLVPDSVAVANANEAARAAARFRIGSCEDDAVARALEDIACATERGCVPAFMGRAAVD